jgi:hypothetical protein
MHMEYRSERRADERLHKAEAAHEGAASLCGGELLQLTAARAP